MRILKGDRVKYKDICLKREGHAVTDPVGEWVIVHWLSGADGPYKSKEWVRNLKILEKGEK